MLGEVVMFHKTGGIVLMAVVGGLAWMAWGSQDKTATPDDHGAALIATCRKAYDHCDADAFLAQIYTGDTAEAKDLSLHRTMFEQECRRSIQAITTDPLESDDVTTYEAHGVYYKPTLPPAGKLVVHFTADGNEAVHDEVTTFLVGRKDGRWHILTAEPVP